MSKIFAGVFFAGVQPTLHAIGIIASLHGRRFGSRLVQLVVLVVPGEVIVLVLLVLLVVALLMVVVLLLVASFALPSCYYTKPLYKLHLSCHYGEEFHCIRNIRKAACVQYLCNRKGVYPEPLHLFVAFSLSCDYPIVKMATSSLTSESSSVSFEIIQCKRSIQSSRQQQF